MTEAALFDALSVFVAGFAFALLFVFCARFFFAALRQLRSVLGLGR